MFSAVFNAQNKLNSIPIDSVTWSISGPTNSTYSGSAQSVTVVSVSPAGATYSTSTTSATNALEVASTTITGTGIYTGSFTSPNLTIVAATISGTAANPSSTYNGSSQSGTVITGVSPAGATYNGSLTVSGTNAGTYTSSITGTGNYTGTVYGGTFTINRATPTIQFQFFFDPWSSLYSAEVRVTDPLSSGVGIAYTDTGPFGSGSILNLTTTFQSTGNIYSRGDTIPYNTSQTTNWTAIFGSFNNP